MSGFERFMLSLAVPSLGLPALDNPTDDDLRERAAEIGYGELAPRGEGNLRALMIVLGVLPGTYEERLATTE